MGMGRNTPTSAERGDASSVASADPVPDRAGGGRRPGGEAGLVDVGSRHDEVAQFVAAHRRALLRVALGVCREPNAAEDLVQDTAVRLLVHWDKVRAAREPFAYARTILVRLYLDQVRSREAAVVSSGGREPEAPDEYAHVESVDAAVQMIAGLPPRARAVLTLRYVEDLDDREIARVLGMSRSTVRVTAHQALRRLSVDVPGRP